MEKTIEIQLAELKLELQTEFLKAFESLASDYQRLSSLKPLKVTADILGVMTPEWVKGQSEYLVKAEAIKSLIEEVNDSRRLVGGIEAICTYLRGGL